MDCNYTFPTDLASNQFTQSIGKVYFQSKFSLDYQIPKRFWVRKIVLSVILGMKKVLRQPTGMKKVARQPTGMKKVARQPTCLNKQKIKIF